MLQINYIRQNVELVKERLSAKYFLDTSLVDTVIDLDDKARKIKVQAEALQSEMNAASKEIGMLMEREIKKQQNKKNRRYLNTNKPFKN